MGKIQKRGADLAEHGVELGDFLFTQTTFQLEVEDGVGRVKGFACGTQFLDVGGVVQIGVEAHEANCSGGELFVAGGAIGFHFNPPSMTRVAAFHGVRCVNTGHEVKWLTSGACCGRGDMDVTEQPSVQAGVAEIAISHVEVTLIRIETQSLDVSMSDTDVKHVRGLFLFSNPSDGVLLTVLARAGTGVEADAIVVTLEVLGASFGEGEQVCALCERTELLPEFAIHSFVVVVISGKHEDGLAFKFCEDFHRTIDLGFGDGGFIKKISCHDDEMRVAIVCGGHHAFKRSETLINEPTFGRLRVLVKREADVVVGGVKNTKAHGEEEKKEKVKCAI